MKRALMIGGFTILAALAVAGWVRKPAQTVEPDETALTTPSTAYAAPAAPAVHRAAAHVQPAAAAETRVVKRERPFSHSAAIVAGSAGAGAAIGGIAGGGKGAAIGALSGGAAGFIYDRLTHNK